MNWYKKSQDEIEETEPIPEAPVDTWFNGSVVVDAEGNPLTVYHGTRANFDKFDLDKCAMGIIWFSSDVNKILNGESGACGSAFIKEAQLAIRNPAGWAEYERLGIGELKRDGYDGIILDDNYVVFDPSQIRVLK